MCSVVVCEEWVRQEAVLTVDDFFGRVDARPCALFYGPGDWILLGREPLLVCDTHELPALAMARRGDVPPIAPDWLGFIAYEYSRRFERLLPAPRAGALALPDCRLVMYREMDLYDQARRRLYTGRRTQDGAATALETRADLGTGPFRARKIGDTDTPAAYRDKVAAIRSEIGRGNVYQVNLTRQERWAVSGSRLEFARRLFAANPAPFSALVADAGFTVISSSPERFVRLREGRLLAQPIKGTADRGADEAEDGRRRRELLGSAKDLAELAMITDLIRNDLSRVCTAPSVTVTAFPRLETFANVHHLVADVVGAPAPALDFGGLLTALFPGGSITGCPKLAAMIRIRELEALPRQIYTGAIGWLSADFGQCDFNIAIRTCWEAGGELRFGVGGGVVWDSDPAAEYAETVAKGRSIVACLS
ncbi:MAG TPA: anthranilate synthase component I family protein [Acidobacteriota bacterium]|nr:anthranilate synthase component I family protein [Acidobacteriota bacterium]